jgi:hypothetical protein
VSRKFNVGDRVRYIGRTGELPNEPPVGSENTLPVGTEGVIVPMPAVGAFDSRALAVEFSVRSRHESGLFACFPEWLQHVYDGNEKVSWTECAWRPKSLEVR